MQQDCAYGFGTTVAAPYQEAVAEVEKLLDRHGFTVYTRMDLEEIVGPDLSDSFDRYRILGACNPEFAKILFRTDPDIGLLMPCNIVIYELRGGGCRVMVKDPARIMDMIKNPATIEAAMRVRQELEDLIAELAGQSASWKTRLEKIFGGRDSRHS